MLALLCAVHDATAMCAAEYAAHMATARLWQHGRAYEYATALATNSVRHGHSNCAQQATMMLSPANIAAWGCVGLAHRVCV